MLSLTALSRLALAVFFSVSTMTPIVALALPTGVVNDLTPPPAPTAPVVPTTTTSSTSPSQNNAAHQAQNQNQDSGAAAKAIGAMLMAMGAA